VERVRSQKDRRIVHLKLTMRGRVVGRAYHTYHNRMVRSFLQNRTDEELQTIYNAFKNLDEFLNSH
ncbi:MAG: MarR family winged helix-turn-helix transcriptional regulator, partial [Lactobacillus sp.]|nr:MarR family winged helix-turn-helix transcriptional regulator [Lactobacillus sp.]